MCIPLIHVVNCIIFRAVVDMTKQQLRKKLPEKQRVVQYEEEYLLEPFGTYKIAAELCEMSMLHFN